MTQVTNCRKKSHEKPNDGLNWVRENKAIIAAILLLMLCFGILDTVEAVVNKTILHFTKLSRNPWLDWFFIIITVICGGVVLFPLIKNRKKIAPRTISLLLVPVVLFVYYRFATDSPYVFTSFWNGPICYLDGFALISIVIICLFVFQQFKKTKEESQNDKFSFDTDAPIKFSDKDLFNMGSLVKRIVNYIASTDIHDTAFSMGIVGEWGDGKTSLMNLVEEKIKEEHKDFIIVHFNPRASKKADFIQEDFLESLKQALSPKHSSIDRSIDKYAIAIDVIPDVPVIVSKGLELLQIRSDKKREITRGELIKAIKEIDQRIVVFVDDLDRLTGEELIEVLKVLDTNGAFPNMVFLTSYDKDYVNAVLNNYLHLENHSRAYTDKYFTVEIRVPLHPSFRLMDYLVKLLTDASKSGFITQLNEVEIEEQTRKLSSYIMSRLHTIRDIKRFVNQFLYDYAEIQRDVFYNDFLLLELIKYAHHEDYEAIYKMKYIHRGQGTFLTSASNDLIYLNDILLPKKNKSGIDEEPNIKPDSIDILKALFPEESGYQYWYAGRYQRIYCVSSFEHYFYNYEYSHLKSEDLDRLFNEDSLNDANKLIDSWGNFSKDLETYLLTRDVNAIKSKSVLRRYLQILLYASHKHQSINYLRHDYSFLRKDDVTQMIENCGFSSAEEYIQWFKETMLELTAIDPMIPANYMRTPISGMFGQGTEPDLCIMTLQEMQNYALELLNDYIKLAGTEGWDVKKAYSMAQIHNDENGAFLPAASIALHDVMVLHFDLFSETLPFFVEGFNGAAAGYTVQFPFKSVFKDREEFERLIMNKENDDVPEIKMVRAIWPIYKANGCSNFNLPNDLSIDDAKKTMLRSVLEDLAKYEEINKKMDKLANDWKKGHDQKNVDAFVNQAEELKKELNAIPLRIKLAETYTIEIRDMINEFQNAKSQE